MALDGGADLVLEMDSDFSHDPADLPRLIAAADDADLVLGSRYVAGGGVTRLGAAAPLREPRRVGLRARGARSARCATSPAASSASAGRCWRALDLEAVHANGYAFQIELTYRAARAGFSIAEVPIVFRDRRAGESKMTPGIALEAVWVVPSLRFRS